MIAAARDDLEHGVYYAAPFLMGTRPSEQLGLLWDASTSRRTSSASGASNMRNGGLAEMTKTAAGGRSIPMSQCRRGASRRGRRLEPLFRRD